MEWRWSLAVSAGLAVSAVGGGPSAGESEVTFPLHAQPGNFEPCEGDPCGGDSLRTMMTIGEFYTVLLFVSNYDRVMGVNTALDWPADWSFLFSTLDCAPGQMSITSPSGPGPSKGRINTSFNCLTDGTTQAVGRIVLKPTSAGCVRQVRPLGPTFGIAIQLCDGGIEELPAQNLGSVCAGSVGIDVCDGPVAVESATWGKIKASYR